MGAGVVATCVVFWLLFLVVGLPLFPVLYPAGVELPIGLIWPRGSCHATSSGFTISHLLLGWPAVVVSAFAGLNGALSAATTAFGGFTWVWGPTVVSLIPWIWEPISNPGEVYTRAENLGNLLELRVVFCFLFPFVALAGYLGARVGGRLRNGLLDRCAGRSGVRGDASWLSPCVFLFFVVGLGVVLPDRLISSGIEDFKGRERWLASQALFHIADVYGNGFLEIGDYNGPPLVLGWHVKSVEACPGTSSKRDFEMGHYLAVVGARAEVGAYSLFGLPLGEMEVSCRGHRKWEPYF